MIHPPRIISFKLITVPWKLNSFYLQELHQKNDVWVKFSLGYQGIPQIMEVQRWIHREYAYSSCSSSTLKDCDPDQNALHTHKLYRFPSLTSLVVGGQLRWRQSLNTHTRGCGYVLDSREIPQYPSSFQILFKERRSFLWDYS